MTAKLEFILGRSGCGKSAALYSRIAKAVSAGGGSVFVIVPEQESFETERRLSEYLNGGLFGVTVTSWSGLSRRMLDALGDRRAFLSPQGRTMLLRRCADACARELTVFKRSSAMAGFPAECDDLIKKFKRCGMSAEDVGAAAEALEEGLPLRDKLHDISVIFADLEKRCRDRYIDSEDMMNETIRRAAESPLSGAHVFIDGGSAVNEQSYPLFSALLKTAGSVSIALDVDTASRDRRLFAPNRRIFERLCDIAHEAGAEFSTTQLDERLRPGTPAIKHLERELFAYPQRVFADEPEGLSLSVCATRTDEVTEAAEGIRAAAADGMRYRDMAVIMSDIAAYSPIVSRVFSAYGIPFFADVKRSLASYPVAGLILSALKAVQSGFMPEHIIDIMRSGYAPVTDDESERFENYLLANVYYGSGLVSPFTGDGAAFEDIRARIMEPLLRLREGLREGGCEARTRAVHAYMEELGLYEKQKALCDSLREKGLLREEEENAQVFNTVLEVLDQLYVIMGDEQIGLKRYVSVLSEGLSSYEISVIPTTADQVLVGSMDRTRSREVKLLFVLGMTEGLFPRARKNDRVIDDGDLRVMKAHGLELWRMTDELSEGDLLTVWSALSKATERIVFSYPESIPGSAEEQSASPCRIVGVLKKLFPLLPVRELGSDISTRSSEGSAFAALAARLRRMLDTGMPDEETAGLFAYFMKAPEYREPLKTLLAGCFGEEPIAPFGRELAVKLYGSRLYGSASRLEDFNKCPFLHYMRYGLRAEPRKERVTKATDKGTFRHAALEAYVRYVDENGLDWREIDDERTFEILREIIPPIMRSEKNGVLFDTARQRAELVSIIDSIRFTCCALTRHIAAGSFRPSGCEVSFGRPDSIFPPLEIAAGGAVFRISGVIDRIDSFTAEGGETLSRIIDYKSNGKEFRFGHLAAGLQLQLPLYAAAVEAAQTVGMYYMPVMDVPPKTDDEGATEKTLTAELIKQFRLNGISLRDETVVSATEEFDGSSSVIIAKRAKDGSLSGSGLVSGEEYDELISAALGRAASSLEAIFEGEADAHPYVFASSKQENACAYCDFKDVCRFDPELSRSGFRKVYPMSADSFFGRERGNE